VDVVIGTHALPGLLDLIRRAERDGPQMDVREYTEVFPSALPARRDVAHHAWVSIAVGCDNRCTFCIVPLVRGPQRSRPVGEVLAEVQALAASGVLEVTLLGQNVNTFGRDLSVPGSSRRPLFADLLRLVDGVEGLQRIRFTSPHPAHFTPDVIEAMAESRKVCEHIHFPLQSGSDRVLHLMNRSYRSPRYLDWLRRIRGAIPGIAVSTDIIVGFPGETEEDFLATLDVVREARFDQAYTFQYSPRPGTRAFQLPPDELVPKGVVQERFDRLVAAQEEISLERNRELVGSVLEVLVEGKGRKGRAQGRTRSNKLVHFDGDATPGRFHDVRVIGAHPHHLSGEAVPAPSPAGMAASAAAT
jgi:tRNA-2-methylthio-N6-dimethylallyladenosine synthase